MRIVLREFQEEAVRRLARQVRRAGEEIGDGVPQAVVLSSPTGSGKTVMATALIEYLINGEPDGDTGPDPDATFLWITDQPELNEQTRRKMIEHSTLLDRPRLIDIGPSFSEETLDRGRVYFVNTQKLGKGKILTRRADNRPWTLWDTVRNTITERPASFIVVIDEAHRGMTLSARERNDAKTIIQRFVKGSDEVPAIPLIMGISATTARFHALLEQTNRVERKVEVAAEDVRQSGLLKERIVLKHPKQAQPSNITLLRAAAREWLDYRNRWAAYSTAQNLPALVRPVLVVQVEDGSGVKLSNTDLAAAVRAIDDEVGPLDSGSYAHSFQEHTDLKIDDDITLPYIAPPDIEVEAEVSVVFFKTSLNTGWDCPRAEVMMSFRPAKDHTLIAQLVGRMVRTPLAMRVDVDEVLNSVRLYLPRYDQKGLEEVVKVLNSGDEAPPVEAIEEKDVATYSRAEGSEAMFAALEAIPSYIVPRRRITSQVRRLMKLARQLANDEIRARAVDDAYQGLISVLSAQHDSLKDQSGFKALLDDTAKVDLRIVDWVWGRGVEGDAETVAVEIAVENIDDLFKAAARKFGEGLEWRWVRGRVDAGVDATIAKREAFALASQSDVIDALQAEGKRQTQAWLREHRDQIDDAKGIARQTYDLVKQLADRPEEQNLRFPDTIEVRRGPKRLAGHVYVDDVGEFAPSPVLNRWERAVLDAELGKPEVVGWLRNAPNKEWALCVPYEVAGETKSLYPDLLILRRRGRRIEVDVLDPHLTDFADAAPKANGMAKFAAQHADKFGRICLITGVAGHLRSLDLADEQDRQRVASVHDKDALLLVFKEFGTALNVPA